MIWRSTKFWSDGFFLEGTTVHTTKDDFWSDKPFIVHERYSRTYGIYRQAKEYKTYDATGVGIIQKAFMKFSDLKAAKVAYLMMYGD